MSTPEALSDEDDAFADRRAVPPAPVLAGQRHRVAGRGPRSRLTDASGEVTARVTRSLLV